jgi:hypothetical protein
MGRNDEAKKLLEPIRPDWELVESQAYHKLMLLYRGDRTADDVLAAMRADPDAVARATIGYGLGMWHQLNGDRAKAFEIWRETRDRGTWPAFGFIAAEVELARSAASTRGTPAPR